MKLFPMGYSNALIWAVSFLQDAGIELVHTPEQATHILLPVPSFDASGNIRGGGKIHDLPKSAVIIGGMLNRSELQGYTCIDLLTDELYVAKNAMITAYCALKYAIEQLTVTLEGCPVLIIGFGRIGKCLARLLAALGGQVTVAARKPSDTALIEALGMRAVSTASLSGQGYRVIFNTVPAMVLPEQKAKLCRADCLKIDLASAPGLLGEDVIRARGLPGLMAPESSGKLIAKTVIRLLDKKEEGK